jgi:protoheme IX farnesyltransferase
MTRAVRPIVPSRIAGTLGGHESARAPRTVLGGYLALTKPRVIELLLVTTLPAMVLAGRSWPSWSLVAVVLVGGALAAGGANAVNMYVDRDIDRLMARTAGRPLVTGLIRPRDALVFAVALEAAAFALLATGANVLSAVLALSAMAFYVGVYTLWLKRTSTHNIVIGGAAGAVPVLVGWAAVTGSLSWSAVLLFAIIFVWTPPHFWALAIRHADEYRAAGVPMLPSVAPMGRTVRTMVAYTVVLVALTLILAPVADLGAVYVASASLLGAAFLAAVATLVRRPTHEWSMRVFSFSISYVTLLFVALTVDVLVA